MYGPIAHGVLQGEPKVSDVIPVWRPTPIATQPAAVSVFLSVAKCGRVCRAQTCAHSGIEPSTLAKGFLQGGPEVHLFPMLLLNISNHPIINSITIPLPHYPHALMFMLFVPF